MINTPIYAATLFAKSDTEKTYPDHIRFRPYSAKYRMPDFPFSLNPIHRVRHAPATLTDHGHSGSH